MLEELQKLGLSKGLATVYLDLIRHGQSQVHQITQRTKFHRTSIYDYLEKLMQKGLVNFHIEKNIKMFKATSPENLTHYFEDLQNQAKKIIPSLLKQQIVEKDDVIVEVYKGIEGLKFVLNDRISLKADMFALNIDEEIYTEILGEPYILNYLEKIKENNVKEKLITSHKATKLYETSFVDYRAVSEDFFDPTSTLIYADRVAHVIWEPLTVILMKNKNLAEAHKKHFDHIWKKAKRISSGTI